jgi:hypothetical protein
MTSREIGAELGVSHTAINKAARKGRIPREPDGSFDLEKVRAVWDVNVDHRQRRPSVEPKPAVQPAEKLRKGPGKSSSKADPESLYEATRRTQWLKVLEKELDLAKRKGEVMLVAEVEKLIANMISSARGRLLLLANEVAPRVAVITSVLECQAIIDNEVRKALSALSETNAA